MCNELGCRTVRQGKKSPLYFRSFRDNISDYSCNRAGIDGTKSKRTFLKRFRRIGTCRCYPATAMHKPSCNGNLRIVQHVHAEYRPLFFCTLNFHCTARHLLHSPAVYSSTAFHSCRAQCTDRPFLRTAGSRHNFISVRTYNCFKNYQKDIPQTNRKIIFQTSAPESLQVHPAGGHPSAKRPEPLCGYNSKRFLGLHLD